MKQFTYSILCIQYTMETPENTTNHRPVFFVQVMQHCAGEVIEELGKIGDVVVSHNVRPDNTPVSVDSDIQQPVNQGTQQSLSHAVQQKLPREAPKKSKRSKNKGFKPVTTQRTRGRIEQPKEVQFKSFVKAVCEDGAACTNENCEDAHPRTKGICLTAQWCQNGSITVCDDKKCTMNHYVTQEAFENWYDPERKNKSQSPKHRHGPSEITLGDFMAEEKE